MRTGKRAGRARAPASRKLKRLLSNSALELTVQYATTSRNVPSERELRLWTRAALKARARVTVRLVGLAEGRALNRAYRGNDYATNVLTFVLNDGRPYECDLALCAPVVSREARSQGKDITAHYAHLTVHGLLHLQGYEHATDGDAAAMERLEARILKRLGYANPYDRGPRPADRER